MNVTIEPIQTDPNSSMRCLRRREPSFPFEWHFHPEYELTWIVHGRGQRFVGDHIADYREGDLVLLGSNLPHTWQSNGSATRNLHEALVIQFRPNCLGKQFFSLPETRGPLDLLDRSHRGLRFRGKAVKQATARLDGLAEREPFDRLIRLLQVLDILSARAVATQILAGVRYKPSLNSISNRRMDTIASYVLARLDQTITQREVANMIHMNPSSFSRFFKRTAGRTFVDYVHELRIGEACRWLVESDLSITEIAQRVGYDNLTYFDRRFRRIKGMTARQWRRAGGARR